VEKRVPFFKEIAIMVVLTTGGQTCSYPVLETVHKDIYHLVFGPLHSRDSQLAARAQHIAERTARSLRGGGVFGMEMLIMTDGAFNPLFHSQVN
jgi:phosphoribosylaminoimidazole carboxylase